MVWVAREQPEELLGCVREGSRAASCAAMLKLLCQGSGGDLQGSQGLQQPRARQPKALQPFQKQNRQQQRRNGAAAAASAAAAAAEYLECQEDAP